MCIFILDLSICFKHHLTSRNSKLVANSKFPALAVDSMEYDAYRPVPILQQFDKIIHPPIIIFAKLPIILFAVSLLHKLGKNNGGQCVTIRQ